jgi:hypothetical protein
MRSSIIANCVDMLKKEDFKRELKVLSHPILEVLVDELKPYIFSLLLFLVANFFLLLGIWMYLIRWNKRMNIVSLKHTT